MTILSDTTIREFIKRNELIVNGDPSFARNCAYEFKAARVVYGGTDPNLHQVTAVDLTSGTATTAVIPPSGVVWVRSREQVRISHAMVGLWVQTNSLSRTGLLLLNSTLVEPGYVGHLAAHFVNLGATDVLLSAGTTIAKLMFMQLDLEATELIDSTQFRQYDVMIDGLAARSDKSFLRIRELVPDLEKAASASVADAQRRIADETAQSLKDTREKLQDLQQKTFIRIGGGFVLGLVLAVGFALWIYPFLRSLDIESKSRMIGVVKEQNATLVDRLDKLQADMKELSSARKQSGPLSRPGDTKK
jgi:deoxycytidine triphosphate deaminase